METAALFSPSDVNAIRRYVQTKYAPLPGGKRAEMVADAIRRTLEQRLPELPVQIKSKMSADLIRRCLLTEQRDVLPDDVLEFCAGLNLPAGESEKLLEPMLQWINERTPGLWSEEHVTSRLVRRKVIPLAPPIAEPEPVVEVILPPQPEAAAHLIVKEIIPSIVAVEPAAIPQPLQQQPRWQALSEALSNVPRKAWTAAACVVVAGVIAAVVFLPSGQKSKADTPQPSAIAVPLPDIGMPQQLKYRDFDEAPIRAYLHSRDALLAEEPYFSAIVESAENHDVNPLLLFAIVGQEQGFVPKSNKNAKQIANNPFNVFHSWQEYNTDIQDSSDIAARTISRRGKTRPEGHEPFEWFNKKYAEDPQWGNGVKQLFDQLTQLSPSK